MQGDIGGIGLPGLNGLAGPRGPEGKMVLEQSVEIMLIIINREYKGDLE